MLSAFGLAVELALPVPELDPPAWIAPEAYPPGPPLRVELVGSDRVESAWSGPAHSSQVLTAVVDGSVWSIQRGQDGDLRMDHALARFHLDDDAGVLLCGPTDEADPAWRRLLLDTALVTASLARGLDALHAGCVVSGGSAVAIAGPSGAGKTTLMLELLRAGARFLTDDVLAVVPEGEEVLGYPGPPVANLPLSVSAEDVVEPLHRIGEERWGRIRAPHTGPAPLSTVVVVERVAAAAPGPVITRLTEPVAPLLALGLQSGPTAQRLQRRLEVLAQLAQTVEMVRVKVTGETPPHELAAQLIEAVPRLAP